MGSQIGHFDDERVGKGDTQAKSVKQSLLSTEESIRSTELQEWVDFVE